MIFTRLIIPLKDFISLSLSLCGEEEEDLSGKHNRHFVSPLAQIEGGNYLRVLFPSVGTSFLEGKSNLTHSNDDT